MQDKMMDKKLIDVYVSSYSEYDLEGSVKELVKIFNYCIEEYGDDCFLRVDGPAGNLSLYRKRLETDKEYAKRIKKEEVATKMEKYKKGQKEKRELKEYERLKKKFG